MPAAATIRRQIELTLESRFPAALSPSPRTIREVASTGIDVADRLLDGGLPVGAISEIFGPASSGRTSLALSFLAQRTAEGRVCAWVDVHDTLDPESAAVNGVHLKQLLWVRCRDQAPEATGRSFRRDRKPWTRPEGRPWTRLDQALRATDLLLQAGGFAAIVLDLGETAPEYGCRIPLATWFRFRQAADRARCSLLLLGQVAFAQSSSIVALVCLPLHAETAGETVLRGFTFSVLREKHRFARGVACARKPPASTWSAAAAWEAEKSS